MKKLMLIAFNAMFTVSADEMSCMVGNVPHVPRQSGKQVGKYVLTCTESAEINGKGYEVGEKYAFTPDEIAGLDGWEIEETEAPDPVNEGINDRINGITPEVREKIKEKTKQITALKRAVTTLKSLDIDASDAEAKLAIAIKEREDLGYTEESEEKDELTEAQVKEIEAYQSFMNELFSFSVPVSSLNFSKEKNKLEVTIPQELKDRYISLYTETVKNNGKERKSSVHIDAQKVRAMYAKFLSLGTDEKEARKEICEMEGCLMGGLVRVLNYQTQPIGKDDTAYVPLVNSIFPANWVDINGFIQHGAPLKGNDCLNTPRGKYGKTVVQEDGKPFMDMRFMKFPPYEGAIGTDSEGREIPLDSYELPEIAQKMLVAKNK